jgi:hypothetical protein
LEAREILRRLRRDRRAYGKIFEEQEEVEEEMRPGIAEDDDCGESGPENPSVGDLSCSE